MNSANSKRVNCDVRSLSRNEKRGLTATNSFLVFQSVSKPENSVNCTVLLSSWNRNRQASNRSLTSTIRAASSLSVRFFLT